MADPTPDALAIAQLATRAKLAAMAILELAGYGTVCSLVPVRTWVETRSGICERQGRKFYAVGIQMMGYRDPPGANNRTREGRAYYAAYLAAAAELHGEVLDGAHVYLNYSSTRR